MFVYVKKFSIFIHLFSLDSEGLPIGKLDMRQRLIIALGAAKGRCNVSLSSTDCNGHEIMRIFDPTNLHLQSGLEHLHSLVPPILHMHFRTRNVLVDESFTAKVSDFGLSNLPMEGYYAESSSAVDCFRDPEYVISILTLFRQSCLKKNTFFFADEASVLVLEAF